jgi:hypothetical protein
VEKEYQIKSRTAYIADMSALWDEMQKAVQRNKLKENIHLHPEEENPEKVKSVNLNTIQEYG